MPDYGAKAAAFRPRVRPKTWFTLGVDYTRGSGDLSLTPPLLLPSLQTTLGGLLQQLAAEGLVPAGYSLVIPAHSVTQTIAAGPELVYRHFTHVTNILLARYMPA